MFLFQLLYYKNGIKLSSKKQFQQWQLFDVTVIVTSCVRQLDFNNYLFFFFQNYRNVAFLLLS